MSLIEIFKSTINGRNLFSKKDELVVAVSGGMDSMVLCKLCMLSGYSFVMAHCNFQLRGEESNRDEDFVREWATANGIEFVVKKFDTENYASDKKISIQEAARELRYEWFHEIIIARENQYPGKRSLLLTAHHADDNAETLLMNFCRGTGLQGLTGIPIVAGKIRRPLLTVHRKMIENFSKDNSIPFVEDSSNISVKYTRNLFRHEVFPGIAKAFPQVKENLANSVSRFESIAALYQLAVGKLLAKLVVKKGKEVHIPVKQLMSFRNNALIYELISPYGFNEGQVEEVIKLASSDSGRYIDSPSKTFRIIRHRHWFIISPAIATEAENIILEQGMALLEYPGGMLNVEVLENKEKNKIASSPAIAQFDASMIEFPLLLRKWKPGDYFYPLGMKKKKKVSRFLIDQKLSLPQKERVWVLEMSRKIVWVVGMRIDDRFKVTDGTSQYIMITSNPSREGKVELP